jgi:hypothetical protein
MIKINVIYPEILLKNYTAKFGYEILSAGINVILKELQ